MSLEAWGDSDEYMRAPDGYVTDEQALEMVQEAKREAMQKAIDLIRDRLGAYRSGHANDATAWEHFNTGFAEGMQEALGIVEAVQKDQS